VLDLLKETIINTVMFYADNGDIVTAAHIALVFYVSLTGDNAKNGVNQPPISYLKGDRCKPYLQRVLCNYLETL